MDLTTAMEIEENHEENSSAQPILIEDVLSKIFEFLPCRDRKNIKLVCKQWLQVLRRQRFVQKEAFFFPHFYSYTTVMKVVDDCYRGRLMNLKFELRQFTKNSQIFWRKCGSKIESLHFTKCSFYSDMLLHVFTYCVNLKHLHVEESGTPCHPGCALLKDISFPVKNRNLIQENLSFMDVCVGVPLNADDLSFVASAFPKLKTLKVSLACASNVERSTFPALVDLLQSRFNRLNTLHVKFSFEDDFSFPRDFSCLDPSNFSGLKNVSFSFRAFRMSAVENIETALRCKYWTAVTLTSDAYDAYTRQEMLNSDCVTSMLEQNLLLKELEIDFSFTTELKFCAFFAALVKSSLKCLRLKFNSNGWINDDILAAVESFSKNLSKNYTLLHMRFNTDFEKIGSLFYKYFPNVRDWESDSVIDVNTIIEYRKNLRSLRINPNVSSLVRPESMKSEFRQVELVTVELDSLVNLQARVLSLLKPHLKNRKKLMSFDLCNFTDFLGVEFLEIKHFEILAERLLKFPNLLYLTFDDNPELRRSSKDYQNTFEEMPKWFAQKFPNLRGIEIRWFNQCKSPNLEELIVLSQSFQNLRDLRYISLYIQSADCTLEAHLKNIVTSYLFRCPSLKALWITNGKFRHNHFYDILCLKFRPFSQCNVFYSNSYDDCVNLKSYWLNER